MTDLTPNHPAVEELARELAELKPGEPWPSNEELGGHRLLGTRDDEYRFAMRDQALELMSLVAPRITSAAEENLDFLRNTPAGKQLLAEGWEEGAEAAWGRTGEGFNGECAFDHLADRLDQPSTNFRQYNPDTPNPYREGDE